MEKFVIIKFISEDDSVAIISSMWISEDRKSCVYPNGPNATKYVKKHESPALDWKAYPIQILAEDVNYDDARRHLVRAENTSNLDSEPEMEKRKRKTPLRFHFEDSDEETEVVKEPKRLKKRSKVSCYPSLDSFASPVTCSIPSIPSCSIPSIPSCSIPSILSCSIPSIPSYSTPSNPAFSPSIPSILPATPSLPVSSPINSSFQHSPASYPRTHQTSEMDARLALMLGQFQSTLTDLVLEVKEMGRKLDVLQNNANFVENSSPESEREISLIGMLPVNNLDEFEKIEEKLREGSFRKVLVKILISLGGRDCKSVTYNMLKRVLTNEVAMHFSFTGKASKCPEGKEKKKPFCPTFFYKSIQDSVRKVYPDTKEQELKYYVSLWLQQAKHRLQRREGKEKTIEAE